MLTKLSNLIRRRKTPQPDFLEYEIVDCYQLLNMDTPGVSVTVESWGDGFDVAIPAISYGHSLKPHHASNEWPHDSWNQPIYHHPGLKRFRFENAVLHTELGIITVGKYCVRESLHMVFPKFHGFSQSDADHICLPNFRVKNDVKHAVHALCGYCGNRNYAHWWVDVLPILGKYLFHEKFNDAYILMSRIRAPYQQQTLELFFELKNNMIFIDEDESVRCKLLDFVPLITAGDYMPDPLYMETINALKIRAGVTVDAPEQKIFLSRKDAPARQMLNEDALCEIAAAYGYRVISTTGMHITEQIKMFASASHVISAHGAGLANMLFCPPDSRILELHSNHIVNWSLRRLASIVPLKYGCLIGRQVRQIDDMPKEPDEHTPWSIEPDVFETTLRALSGRIESFDR